MMQAKACKVASHHRRPHVPSKERLMSHRLAYVFGVALVLPVTVGLGSPAKACGHAAYFVSGAYSTTEGSSVNVAIRRDANSCGGPSSVEYATEDGSANAGSDYTAVSGTATFEMGPDPAAQRTFSVPVVKDSEAEGAETFTVVLRMNAANGVISSLGPPATVTIAASTQSSPVTSPAAPSPPTAPAPAPEPARTATTTRLAPSTTVATSTSTSSSTTSTSTTSTTTLGGDEVAAAPTSSKGRGLPVGLLIALLAVVVAVSVALGSWIRRRATR